MGQCFRSPVLGPVDVGDSHGLPFVIQAPLRRGLGMLDRDRFVVGDTAWEKAAPLLPGKPTDPGATGKDNRLFLEAVLWRVRTGVPWRDLPGGFGKWNSVFQRFRRWVKGGVFERASSHACPASRTSSTPWSTAPSSPPTTRRAAQGGTQTQAIGRSRGGLATKIVALVDALGNLARFVLLPGQHHDTVGVRPLIEGVAFGALLGDKAFDADWLRADLDST